MFLNLYLDDAVAAVDLFFDSITAKVDVTVRPQFVQSEQKLAIEKRAPAPCIRQYGRGCGGLRHGLRRSAASACARHLR